MKLLLIYALLGGAAGYSSYLLIGGDRTDNKREAANSKKRLSKSSSDREKHRCSDITIEIPFIMKLEKKCD